MELLQDLNPSQREAVMYNEGPSLIIAGAGAGKTRVLTYKVAYLLQQGVPANRILCLTFTNKAAREMKERIQHLVSPEAAHYLWMGTFHSIAARILRAEADKLGYTRDFSIYDTPDMKSVVKSICKDKGLDEKVYKPNMIMARISDAKNHLETADEYAMSSQHAKDDRNNRLYEMAWIYREYERRLRAANAMDFDDLLMNLCLLLQKNYDVRTFYQQIFQYILVDEYQDTNYVQYLLVKILAEPENLVFVVGDDAQSIYSFRGADIRNILSFQQGYADSKLFKLEQNYRSTQTIVNAANSLIHHNANQIYKQVYSENAEGDRLQLTAYMSDRDEAAGVARQIKSLASQSSLNSKSSIQNPRKLSYDDIAILYRTNAQSRAFENELRRLNIPYRIYGGTSFYQRKEIKDAIGYFRLAVNPKDTEALLRVVNFPARGIGDVTLKKISECSIQRNLSMMDVIADPTGAELNVSSGIQNKLQSFAAIVAQFQECMDTKDAYEFAELVLMRSGVMTAAAADTTPEGKDRKENLDELLSGIHEFVRQRQEEGIDFTPIQDFLAEVSLLTDQDENLTDHTSRVTLMTVHAAKGLEFPRVFIVGLEENLFPSQFCEAPHEIEEERRLLYVAITRAMEHCSLSYARQRFRNGQVSFSSPSRFLKDIDKQFVQQLRPTGAPSYTPSFPSRSSWSTSSAAMPSSPTPTRLPSLSNLKPVTPDSPVRPISERPATPDSPSADSPFVAGDRVSHRVFGNGTVQRVYNENDNDKIDILFDGPGKKTLLLTYAKLEKIE
ncbi:MAG: UvrD-helicase domain-containing protein [Paludibacteraceae bacterium]|nr:UvrD-helicase domain-containing protein [Paludibacteraceae bacterium]